MDTKPNSSALSDLSVILSDAHGLLTKLEDKLAQVSSQVPSDVAKAETAAGQLGSPDHVHSLISSANRVRERLETILNGLVI